MFVGAALRDADQADLGAVRQPGDLVDELEVSRADQHRHDRDAPGDEDLRLVGMEGGGRDQVVVEPLEPVGQVVQECALGLDHARERVDQPFGVVAGVGVRAFREQHADQAARVLALGGGGEGRGGQLVGREPGVRRPAGHLRHDPGQRLGAAALRRALGDVGAGAVAAGDIAGIGEAPVDRPDRVRIDAERRAELADRGESRARAASAPNRSGR